MHYALVDALILTGDGREHSNGAIEIFDGRIVKVGSSLSLPAVDEIVPLDGRVVMPGLIDLHTHLVGGDKALGQGDNALSYKMADPLAKAVLESVEAAAVTIQSGVTTVQDLGARDYLDIFLRNAQREGLITAPRILAAGAGVFVPGGHGSFWEPNRGVEGSVEAVRRVKELSLAGVDVIKVVSADGPEFSGDWTTVQSTPDEIEAAFCEARRLGKRTTAHAMGGEAMINVARGGAETIQHGWYLTEEACDWLVKADIHLVPTLGEVVDIVEQGPAPDMPWASDFGCERDGIFERISYAIQRGVKIAMGSDCGGVEAHFHGANADELVWYQECGLSSDAAIASATIEAARALRVDAQLGTIEEGKLADMLILRSDPRDNLRYVQDRLVGVIQGGEVVRDDAGILGGIKAKAITELAQKRLETISAAKWAAARSKDISGASVG
ncbi:MAG: amidohydrolase family protein [Bryobacterales bacterium]|nr:amidohydrolase family protein [Bryobacterales bacterium]MDE0336406.1 amidohydrolase family protein [Caldilineaceae bacterium]